MGGVLDDCRLRFVQKCRRPPQKTPDFGGPKKTKINFKIHGHVTLPKSYQIDELRSQTLQSHVSYTYLPSALEISPWKRAGDWWFRFLLVVGSLRTFFSYIGQIEITSPLRVFKGSFRGRWVSRCMRHATAKFGSLVHRFGMIPVGVLFR